MDVQLSALPVLVVDCQASGATPAHGDLIELGWAVCEAVGPLPEPLSRWVVPRTTRRISGPVRELTGWSERCLAEALPEQDVFRLFDSEIAALSGRLGSARVPVVIHFARFELPFLRDLWAHHAPGLDPPLDVVCVHQIAARLFPDLPRRNIRALAGHLGHSAELVRRSAGHVQASAFIWRELVSRLSAMDITTWGELVAWLARPEKIVRPSVRSYPLAKEKRRALPDAPGVYRFLRRNGDILYVGKATSLRKRVAGHFRSGGKPTERGLELLTQVHDIAFTQTASVLEAALLETDEIKALRPPYNVQLRADDRQAWFSDRARLHAVASVDAEHAIGPIPSRRALSALSAFAELLGGAAPSPSICARVLAVPAPFLPEPSLFAQGFSEFERDLLASLPGSRLHRLARASRTLWLSRRYAESDSELEGENEWDLARVRRRLERNLVQAGLLERRARWLCMLAESEVSFCEKGMARPRAFSIAGGEIVSRCELSSVTDLASGTVHRLGPRRVRQEGFDAARYDRLRVLATELARVQQEGGELAVRLGSRTFSGARLAQLMRLV